MSDSEYAATADWVRTARTDDTTGDRLESIAIGRELEVLSAIEPAIPGAYVPGLAFAAILIRRVIYDVEPSRLPWRPLLHRGVELRSVVPHGLQSMVLSIVADTASELEADDVLVAQQAIGRALVGHVSLQEMALDVVATIRAETEFAIPFGDSAWARLIEAGIPLAEHDIQAVNQILGRRRG